MIIRINDDIILRELEIGDTADIFHTIDTQREYLGRWLPFVHFTKELSDSENFVKSVIEAPERSRELTFCIRVDGKFAGLAGFKDTDKGNLRTEIGYWLSEGYQGLGIMTEAVRKLCEYAFGEAGMHRIQIKCAVGNTKSSNIPKRLGFTFEGIERAGERTADGGFFDIEVYGKLAGE